MERERWQLLDKVDHDAPNFSEYESRLVIENIEEYPVKFAYIRTSSSDLVNTPLTQETLIIVINRPGTFRLPMQAGGWDSV